LGFAALTFVGCGQSTTNSQQSGSGSQTGTQSGVVIEGLATSQPLTASGIKVSASTILKSATVECGYYDNSGTFNKLNSTKTDSDGKYSLTLEATNTDKKNITVRVDKGNGDYYSSIIPSITSEATNYAPVIGEASDARSKVLLSMITKQGVSRDKIDMSYIERSMALLNSGIYPTDLDELASAIKDYDDSERNVYNGLNIGDADYEKIKDKRSELERIYFNGVRENAIRNGCEPTESEKKTTFLSIEAEMYAYATSHGYDVSSFTKVSSALDTRLKSKLSQGNAMYNQISSEAAKGQITRSLQNKLLSGRVIAKYLGITIPATIEASLQSLISQVISGTITGFPFEFHTTSWALYVMGGSGSRSQGPSGFKSSERSEDPATWWTSSNSLIKQLFVQAGSGSTEYKNLKSAVDTAWGSMDVSGENTTDWVNNIKSAQATILAAVGTALPSLTTQNGVTADEVRKAVALIIGPGE